MEESTNVAARMPRSLVEKNGRKFIFMINPVSGTHKKESILEYLHTLESANGLSFEISETNSEGDYDYLVDKIRTQHITDVIIIGGDGSVNQIVGALYKDTDVCFGIVPQGSGNGLALTAGISTKPLKAIDQILSARNVMSVDAFHVNDKFACMLSGLGLDAKVAHEFAHKERRGLITYTQQSIVEYFKAQPYQFGISVEDFSFYTDAFFISIANSNQFGNNFTIAPQAELNDGLLDIVIVQKMNKAELPFAVLKQIRGNNKLQQLVEDMSRKTVLYFQTPALKIKNLMHAPMHIDGEPVDSMDELDIHVIPHAFKLIC